MIEPYQVVGLVPTMWGIRHRDEIKRNIEHLNELMTAASWLSSMALPVRLITIPEGSLQGFNDEVLDHDHEWFAEHCAIDVPGPETDALGAMAAKWNAYVMATAKVRHANFPRRFFNAGFAISPANEIVLTHYKLAPLQPVEHSLTPHNVWDQWIELYGDGLDAFYPVADTEIGRLGIMMANEASYPENARGLAMNGCEIAYRGPYPHPYSGNGFFEIQNRARALDNNMYVVGNQVGTYYLDSDSEIPIDTFGSPSMICDYQGNVVAHVGHTGHSTYVAGTIDIESLRKFRSRAQFGNWLKDLTTEQYEIIYRNPIYPKNLYLNRKPYNHAEYRREVTNHQIAMLHDEDVWRPPAQ